jgi:hypothetical protein
VRRARESCFGGSDGPAAQPAVASAACGSRSRSLPREGVRQSLRRPSFAAISCVRNRSLRRSKPWRCGDVEIRSFGIGFEHHPVERASPVDFGRSGRTWTHRLRPVRRGWSHGVGFGPRHTASWVCIEISQCRASAWRTTSLVTRLLRGFGFEGGRRMALRRHGSARNQRSGTDFFLLVRSDRNRRFGVWGGQSATVASAARA